MESSFLQPRSRAVRRIAAALARTGARGKPAPGRPPTPAKPPPPPKPAVAPAPGDKAAQAAEKPAGPSAPLLISVGELAMMVVDEPAVPKTIDSIIDLAESL